MTADLGTLLNLYVFSTGRRLFALQQVQKLAKDRGLAKLEAHIAAALKHDRQTLAIEQQWETSGASAPKGEAARIDNLVDRTLSALRDAAQAQAEGAEPGDEIAEMAESLLTTLFPAGVAAITNLSFIEELAVIDSMIFKLKGPLAPAVKELGLTRLAKRLTTLADEYRGALSAPSPALKFGEVRAARARGQEMLLEVVAMVLGEHPLSTIKDLNARTELLAPILRQNEEIGQAMRARRALADVDPGTGATDSGAAADSPKGAPAEKSEGE
jgi:hypothetical protein